MIQSVDRAVRILTALQGARRLSLGEVATRLGLPPSTVHGIMRTLLAHGMVLQERDSGHYRLGPATLRLGNVYLDTLDLRSKVATWSPDLARRTGCAVRTGVMLLSDVIVVHHEPRPDGSRQMPEVGIVIPAHASALGKAVIAFDSRAREEALAPGVSLRSMTGETIVDAAQVEASLAEVRATALATEVEEAVLGECCAAAPVLDASGDVVGAIGLVVPSTDWPPATLALDALRAAARAVSREFGAAQWPPLPKPDRARPRRM